MKRGHYCRICGHYRANEKFSGRGHATHICKDCAKLSPERRDEVETINRIEELPFWLSKEKKEWLQMLRTDKREAVRGAAELAYQLRFGVPIDDLDTASLLDEILGSWDGDDDSDALDLDSLEYEELPF